jgi:hypothetical protein
MGVRRAWRLYPKLWVCDLSRARVRVAYVLESYCIVAFEILRSLCFLVGTQGRDSVRGPRELAVGDVFRGKRLRIEQPENTCKLMRSSRSPSSNRVLLQ